MAWRNQGMTGSNNIPLGTRRRFGGGESASPPSQDVAYHSAPSQHDTSDPSFKRGRSPVRGKYPPARRCIMDMLPQVAEDDAAETSEDGVKKRKKRNRWGDAQENKAAGLMGLPTMIMANMTNEQLEAYTLHLRIEEISQKLRINDVVPADGDR